MSKLIEKHLANCPTKHISAVICKYEDGSFDVKCVNRKLCGDNCPYLKDPDYKSPYKRAPEYKPK